MSSSIYPMIPVPQAIRSVLIQTALLLRDQKAESEQQIDVNCDCVGRVAAETVVMPPPGYPPFPVSVMDGYALTMPVENLPVESEQTLLLPVIRSIFAGDDEDQTETTSLCGAIYVTTGAILPPFCDTVVPVEQVTELGDLISISFHVLQQYKHSHRSMWVRKTGCDLPAGTVILYKGQSIEPPHLGLLLQSNAQKVKVRTKPIVGILSTGNELRSNKITDHSKARTIPDVNRPILQSLLSSFHSCATLDLGIVPDDAQNIQRAIDHAIDTCDVVVSTGGISMGSKDLCQQILLQLGCKIHFGRLHMKPGKPTTFLTCQRLNKNGNPRTCLIFALPGNPVSAFVCTHLLIQPCLDLLHRGSRYDFNHNQSVHDIVSNAFLHDELIVEINQSLKLDPERPEYHRIQLEPFQATTTGGTSTGIQQSSRILSLVGADALLVLPHLQQKIRVDPGERYPALQLHSRWGRVLYKNSHHIQSAKLIVAVISFTSQCSQSQDAYDSLAQRRIQDRVCSSLGGPDHVYMLQTYYTTSLEELQHLFQHGISDCIDVVILVGIQIPFLVNLKLVSLLSSLMKTISVATTLLIRKALAAKDVPLGVLLDPIFGYYEDECKSIQVVSIPECGLESAIISVSRLLKHALLLSRGHKYTFNEHE